MNQLLVSAMLALSLAGVDSICAGANPRQVDQAISRGISFLYSKQHDGNWEVVAKPQSGPGIFAGDVKGSQWGGISALCTFALLAAGESAHAPRIAKAIEWLRTADLRATSAVGARAHVWPRIGERAESSL